jgi:hypothetical protein
MPLWLNEGRFETSELQGARRTVATKKVGKQIKALQACDKSRLETLNSSCDRCNNSYSLLKM